MTKSFIILVLDVKFKNAQTIYQADAFNEVKNGISEILRLSK